MIILNLVARPTHDLHPWGSILVLDACLAVTVEDAQALDRWHRQSQTTEVSLRFADIALPLQCPNVREIEEARCTVRQDSCPLPQQFVIRLILNVEHRTNVVRL